MATLLKGKPLRPNASIEEDYINAILPLVRRMCDEARKVIERGYPTMAQDENDAVSLRVQLNGLLDKYEPLFRKVAKKATKRMIDRTIKYSSVALGQSLKEIGEQWELDTGYLTTPRMQEVITAATTEATSLIRLIPQKYIADVQQQVMRSISTGQGLQDLVPYLKMRYDGNVRHARNVALDQTRKSFSNINATRMQAVGMTTYEWMHVGGSQEPRKNHIAMSGKVYDLNDPPVIGVMYGQEVRGKPGDLPFCRCLMRPILDCSKMQRAA